MTVKLELSLLGTVVIIVNGEQVSGDIPAKSQALLCYLAVTGHAHSRDRLAGLLWGDRPEDKAKANLRRSLSDLRQVLGDTLTIARQTVALNRDSACWLDVEAFESALAKDEPASENEESLCAAMGLYRGEFLEGFSVRQALEFEEWVLQEREHLRQLAIEGLQRLAEACAARGEYGAGIAYTHRLLALEPWHEEAHRRLMTLLARNGQQSAALAQYDTCCRILAEELGVEPLPETQALYHQLKTRREASPHNLPPQTTPFVGRQAELVQIADHLGRPDCRLLTLIGTGGIGKTRLALQAAVQALGAFADGVYFVPLVGVSSSEYLVPTIGDAIGCPLSGEADPKRQLLTYLQQRQMLLVLDNFEHLLSSSGGDDGGRELVLEMVRRAPQIKLLVTSRERLNLQAEWLLTLEGLPYPPAEAGHGEETFEAVELFVQGAQRVRPDFGPSAECPEVGHICRLLDGMPLGIELAATWVVMMSCAEIAGEIARGLDLLATTLHDVPARHRSMEAVFDHSWQVLPESERAVFARLSVFRGGFDRQAAEQVAGASLSMLAALVSKSLLRVVSPGRYDMLEPLRQYAAGKLAQTPTEDEQLQDRYCDYYASFLKQSESDIMGGARQRQVVGLITADIDNIRSSWSGAVGQADLEAIEKSLQTLVAYYSLRGWFQEGIEAFQKAVDGLAGMSGAVGERAMESRVVLGRVLAHQGRFYWHLGRYRKAGEVLRQSLACLRQGAQDTLADVGFVLSQLGLVAWSLGDPNEAQSLLRESLAIGRETGDFLATLASLNNLNHVARSLGKYAEADRLCQEGIDLGRKIHYPSVVLYNLINLAWVANARGDHVEAKQRLHQVLLFHKETNEAILLPSSTWTQLGTAAYLGGAYAEAKQHYLESLEVSQESGEPWHTALALIGLGNTTCALGEYEAAGRYLRRALQIAVEIESLWTVMNSLVGLARLLTASDPGEAAAEQAIALLAFVLAHPTSTQEARNRAAALLAELEARLSPAAVAAAKERGRARDLQEIARQFMPL